MSNIVSIHEIKKILRKGYVAFDPNRGWMWFKSKPVATVSLVTGRPIWASRQMPVLIGEAFCIKKHTGDWKKSVIRISVKGDDNETDNDKEEE